ncbi:hypothetical protein GCM10011529_31730 [Polymorphobacter glacialis]|uniref:Uncharacterized protein n=1 Tax=Sandarakinorhabdus glacialis TaxID=1614636 RepID=A0A917A1U8_9SPHN|nr:hypothetical protein [Polymorphobacter glacialis]GGE22776.1 hypothetical protein GCM10011529_31730 [Polymorphobacter glacialis]
MSRAVPNFRIYAESLIDGEISRNVSSKSDPAVVFVVIKKLSPQFVSLMGAAGFRALVSRALALASKEVDWLGELHVGNDSSFEGMNELRAQPNPKEIADGGIVLLARLLGLLMTLIGEDLTLQLLRNFSDIELGQEN